MDAATLTGFVVVALVAVFTSVTAPLLLARHTERMHREDREADWKRQDEVAARVAQAAATLEANQDMTDRKLDRIHTLVNSEMTAARQAELEQTRRALRLQRQVVRMEEDAGQSPSPEDLEAIKASEERVRTLRQILADRLTQMDMVEAQAEQDRREGKTPLKDLDREEDDHGQP